MSLFSARKPSALFAILLLVFLLPPAFAEDGVLPQGKDLEPKTRSYLVGTPWENWKVPLGTELVTSETSDGHINHRLEFKGGSTFWDHGLSADRSGKGAVLCIRMIYVDLLGVLKKCPGQFDPEGLSEEELKTHFTKAVSEINEFIVANSPVPTTLEELNQNVEQRHLKAACSDAYFSMANEIKKKYTKEKLEKELKELLSVPRPPTMNPCL